MSTKPSELYIPVSLGELIDKITILEIKKENLKGDKLFNVSNELKELRQSFAKLNLNIDLGIIKELKEVNQTLWDIEDKIREKEEHKDFGEHFINLARSVYKKNDIRASIKKTINEKYNSKFIEEKSYNSY